MPHRHRHDGRHFHVRIEVTVPGGAPVVVSHEPSLHGPLKDVEEAAHRKGTEIQSVHRYARVAVHQAFDAARRRLQDFAREQRGAVKTHEVPAHGEIAEISKVDGYGFIQTDGRQIYFSRASVLDDAFDELVVGTPVAFVEEQGEKGPQASMPHGQRSLGGNSADQPVRGTRGLKPGERRINIASPTCPKAACDEQETR